jgi:APA family basic amino acid/polyamine antiporter
MSSTYSGGGAGPTVSTLTAAAIVVADMVGVGVFTSLGFQLQAISSGFSLLMLWVVGGVVALCGAVSYAELAAMFPRSSGEYNFLRRTYHPAFGFLAGWVSATVGFAAPVALAAMAFGEYFTSVITPLVPDALAPWLPLALGLGVTWLAALVHLVGIRFGSAFQNAWTAAKIALIVVFIAAVAWSGVPQPISFAPTAHDVAVMGSGPFAISLVFVMYSYSGWNAATYISGEIREPQKTVPAALFGATLFVTLLYVGLNAVFLYTTPTVDMVGQLKVAMIAGNYVFGVEGGRIVGLLISVGLVSSIGAMTWIGPRVTMAMGEDAPLLRLFSRKSKNGVPAAAIVFQLVVSNLLLLTKSFEAVLDFIQFSLSFCSFCAVLGVIKLRLTHPKLPRPYRAWGFPITPLVFLGVTAFVMYYLVVNRPLQSLMGFAMMLAGLVVYAAATRSARRSAARPSAVAQARPSASTILSVAAAMLFAGPLAFSSVPAVSAELASPDDTAKLLAGMAPAAESPLAAFTRDPSWQRHASYFDAIFGTLDRRQLAKIRMWSQDKLTKHQPVALYMFSGPDFLYADAFFSDASTLVLSALEPVGQIPDVANLRPAALSRTLGNIEGAMKSLVTLSFFRTKDMKTQLAGGGGGVNGTLPILYVFLARTGKVIHNVELVNLDAQGTVIPAEPRAKTGARGVKIDYASADGRMHTLYYFETNLDNDGARTSGFLNFCEQLGPADTFVKSASYLLHQGGFTVVRDFLLKRGGLVLQDDSGIPLSHFDRDKWQLHPFGRYVGPIEIFAQFYQAQLVRLYREGGAQPINFGIGYRWRPNESNLLLAEGRDR